MNWWQDKLAETREPLPPRAPTIPQALIAPTVDDLLAEVENEVQGPTPATSVQERFGVRPGGDIGIVPRRGFATDAPPEKTLLDLSPEAQARLVRKATERGMLGPESERARDAHERAAMIQAAIKDKVWDITEDRTPRKAADTHIAGATWRNER